MASTQFAVIWEQGLDLQTAALLVILAHHFKSSIWLRADHRIARATDRAELVDLRVGRDTRVDIWAEGMDEDWAVKAVVEFFKCNAPTLAEALDAVTSVRFSTATAGA